MDAESAAGGHLIATTLTAREGKGPPSDADTTLVGFDAAQGPAPVAYQGHGGSVGPVGTLRAGSGTVAGGVPFTTHALTSEGADASEDGTGRGTGRGTPIIAFGPTNGIDPQASENVAPTLRAGHHVGGGSVSAATGVRRLTPVECERLQGFPDGWTATSNGRPQSDAARYRQIGNSIAVPVFAWVSRRIVAYGAR